MSQQKQMQVKIPLDKTTGVTCEECGANAFQEALMLRKVSRFLTGDAQDGVMPIAIFACVKCGHVNQEFYPKELVKNEQE